MILYGIFASRTKERSLLNNYTNRILVIEVSKRLSEVAKNNVEVREQFHSALDHNFLWIIDAENAHEVQRFMRESGITKFNAMRIFPVGTFQSVVMNAKNWIRLERYRKLQQVQFLTFA